MSRKSEGLSGAASIETRTSSGPRAGSETVESSMTSEGSPKATSCNCRMRKLLSFRNGFSVGSRLTASGSVASRDENVRAFIHEPLRGGEADAAIAVRDEGDFPFELAHRSLLGCQKVLLGNNTCIYIY